MLSLLSSLFILLACRTTSEANVKLYYQSAFTINITTYLCLVKMCFLNFNNVNICSCLLNPVNIEKCKKLFPPEHRPIRIRVDPDYVHYIY